MNRTGSEIRVGLTIVVALIILIVGIMWGKGYKLKSERYTRIVDFTSISGLEKGARVLVNGVNKGKVDQINLYPDRVEVKIQLDKDVILYTDAKIFVDSPELMGGKVVSIFPGSSGIHAPPEIPLQGSPAVGMTEVLAMAGSMRDDIKEVLSNLNKTLVYINETFGNKEVQQNLQSSLLHLNQASQKIDNLLEQSSPHITSTLSTIDSSAQQVHNLINEHRQEAEQAINNFISISEDLKAAMKDVKDISSTIQNQEGTLGKLVYNPDLYGRLDTTLIKLDSLITKFNREGIHTSVHLFGK
jgi:phospholipid/cholesterol/gamma-HCH transport system substrate-binding protein